MLDEHHYLVSREGTILLRDYGGTAEMVLCEPQDGMGFYSAQPLRGRPLPRSSPVPRIASDAGPVAVPLARGDFATTEDPDYQRILACFKDVPAALEQRIDVDFRKVIGAQCGE